MEKDWSATCTPWVGWHGSTIVDRKILILLSLTYTSVLGRESDYLDS